MVYSLWLAKIQGACLQTLKFLLGLIFKAALWQKM
jgi:hypothetical protein